MPADLAIRGQEGKSKKAKKKKGGKPTSRNEVDEGIVSDVQPHTNDQTLAMKVDQHIIDIGQQNQEPSSYAGNNCHQPELSPEAQDVGNNSSSAEANERSWAPLENSEHGDEKTPSTSIKQSDSPETNDRFDILVRDRDSLRAEVIEMRRSLEQIQTKHDEDMEVMENKLKEAQAEKQHAELQFNNLLGKVNTIKSQLGERLKADAEQLAQAKVKIEESDNRNIALKAELDAKSTIISRLETDIAQGSKELSSLRNRINLSQQNWLKEKDELTDRESDLRVEFEEAKQAMHNWEIIAMEERSIRESLGGKVLDLEEQLAVVGANYEKVTSEKHSQEAAVDGLHKALREIQTARKQELRELVESSDAQIAEFRQRLEDAERGTADATSALERAKIELARALPFEKEVKEKNLLIGKLRHEAVTLNDHLTKALRFLKKGKPEDNVDRNLVTNHFLHFLSLDRSDSKKFQILQLIAALLGWTEEQREQAGLARPGASGNFNSLRLPKSSSMHKTPSSPSLATGYFGSDMGTRKESLAELWSNFLERESRTEGENPDYIEEKPLSP
ncbi:hypothetical protein FQN57_001038 [Myotisia sp. PD_48]|nr:hypothetical protein FQN57_001038 [Myotisia sp. PD_48]